MVQCEALINALGACEGGSVDKMLPKEKVFKEGTLIKLMDYVYQKYREENGNPLMDQHGKSLSAKAVLAEMNKAKLKTYVEAVLDETMEYKDNLQRGDAPVVALS